MASSNKRVSSAFLPPINFDPRSKIPMYRQIYEWFRGAIVDGKLRPGQRVPSTRSLAAELKISRIPVFSAYEQLHAEGYLETQPFSGSMVARTIPDDHLRSVTTEGEKVGGRSRGPRQLSKRSAAVLTGPQVWLDTLSAFRVSLPALEHFPLETWSRLVTRHSRRASRGMLAYGDAAGYLPLREAIADYLGAARGVKCDASQVVITTGSQQALQLCALVLFDSGDTVLVEDPGYFGSRQAFGAAGANLVPVPVDAEGMNPSSIAKRGRSAKAIYITPSHQYPLGITMSAKRRLELLDWAQRNGTWIIEDDYDSEYRYESRPLSSLQGLDADGRVVYIGTFSKVLFPSLRIGYLVVPPDLVSAFSAARGASDIFSSTLAQVALNDFIREGHFARHIRRMRMLYMERRAALAKAIAESASDLLEVVGAEAGMHLTAMLPPGVSDLKVSAEAVKRRISAMPLSPCYLLPPARGGLILGFGGVTPRQSREGVQALRECVQAVMS